MDDVPCLRNLRALCVDQLLGALLHLGSVRRRHRSGHRAVLGLFGKLHHEVSDAAPVPVACWRRSLDIGQAGGCQIYMVSADSTCKKRREKDKIIDPGGFCSVTVKSI